MAVDYFVTVGGGLENFCAREISQLGDVHTTVVGKVFFSTDAPLVKLLQLGVCERLFLAVHCGEAVHSVAELPAIDWEKYVQVWRRLRDVADERETTYRISCRLSGQAKKKSTPREAAFILSRTMLWTVQLREPLVEVCVHLNDERSVVGLALTDVPLSKRPYVKHASVRSTVCRVIATVANIQNGDIVLDPTCGAATILIEAAHFTECACIGVDISSEQLTRASENISQSKANVDIIHADATLLKLAVPVDVVVCDLPFGRKFGTLVEAKALLSGIATNCAQSLLQSTGRGVFLISEELAATLEAVFLEKGWKCTQRHPLRLGKLSAVICLFCHSSVT